MVVMLGMPSAKRAKVRPQTASGEADRCVSPSLLLFPAPAPAPPPNLFPEKQISTYHYKNAGGYGYYSRKLKSRACLDGTLVGECFHCNKTNRKELPIVEFAPFDCLKNKRKRHEFDQALELYTAAYLAEDLAEARRLRKLVEKYRIGYCQPCAEKMKVLSPKEQACKDEYDRMRKEACALNNGCCNPNCVERGPEAWCVLQGDHLHTATDPNPALRKDHNLSYYTYWAKRCYKTPEECVAAMRAERDKGIEWKCGYCHALEPSGKQAKKCKDPATMPLGKRSGTPEERKQYNARHHALIAYPKQQYVDKVKRDVRGCCAFCTRPVLAGKEHAFIFDHIDELTKMKNNPVTREKTLAGKGGGVKGLVSNCATHAALEVIQGILDDEMAKCQLLCHNCDRRKTFGYPMRANVGS